MKLRSKALTISLTTHLLFFGFLLFSALWAKFKKNEEPTILQLVDLPSTESTPSEEPQPALETPDLPTPTIELPSINNIEVDDIPELDLPPEEPPPVQTPPLPKPPTPTPQPVQESPPTQAPTSPAPQKVDFSQFREKHNIPKNTPKPPKPRPAVVAPRINVPTDSPLLSDAPTPSTPTTTTVNPDFMNRYQRALEQHLQNQWDKEISSGSVGLSATVSFQVDLRGRISGARITSSSGDPEFDQAAIKTFMKVRSFTSPPNKKTQRFSITLRGT